MKNSRAALTLALLLTAAACSSQFGSREARPPEEGNSDLYQDADELWVFGRDEEPAAAEPPAMERMARGQQKTGQEAWYVGEEQRAKDEDSDADALPGCGGLMSEDPHSHQRVPVPLEHTDVKGEIRGAIATVDVEQRFHNPFDEKIEAVYVFPLPENAAVHDFVMKIGTRTIRGIVREREEAKHIYERAKALGHVASLLTEERPNIFTQKVANIEPGASLAVSIRYFDTLPMRDGWYEFSFPMVVGPRFTPPGNATPAVDVSYLAPGQRSGHDIALALDLDAGAPIQDWQCRTHAVAVEPHGSARMDVSLKSEDSIPDRDFVLRYRVAQAALTTSVVTGHDERGEYLALTLQPPAVLESLAREPVELVFVLDTSGSMDGKPLALSQRAMLRALERLDERDSFQILRFAENASSLAREPLPATPANIARGRAFVEKLAADGGTMMLNGIRAALEPRADPERQRVVVFMTDGYIGNEREILAEEVRLLGDARVFAFGIGTSVNRYLIEELARAGRGVSAYVGVADGAPEVMEAFFERIRRPALEHIELASSDLELADVYPRTIPDLFHGRPLTIVARFDERTRSGEHWLDVRGRVGGRSVSLAVELRDDGPHASALPWIYGRARIAALSAQALEPDAEPARIADAIRSTALEYGLSSAYTAFVAVDSMTHTHGDHGVSVPVPVEVPAGVRYETTVGAKRRE